MAYTAWSVVFGEQPTAAKWNQLGTNDAGFKDGTNIDNDAILTRHLLAANVTSPKLNFTEAAGSYGNNTTRNYTSTSYVNVTSRSVTVVVGASGKVLLGMGGYISGAPAGVGMFMCANLTGANSFNTDTSPPTDATYMRAGTLQSPAFAPENNVKLLTGLAAGSTTFQLQYRLAGGAGTVQAANEYITVVPL